MNILLIGNANENFCNKIKESKLLKRLYTATTNPIEEFANIEYTSIENLAQKAQALEIDIALLFDNNLLNENIVELFKRYRVNLISTNKKWFNLESSISISKQLLEHYSIPTPKTIKAPINFPILLKTEDSNTKLVVNSIEEIISKVRFLEGQKYILEELIDGEYMEQTSLWDGKNIWHDKIVQPLSEVQLERLNIYKTKLHFLLSDEKADFTGFFVSKLIWTKNDWYNIGFNMGLGNETILNTNKDLLFIINSALYQKLNEI